VNVAHRVEGLVGDDPRWLRAALLHDTGKVWSGLGVVARTAVTLAALTAPVTAARWEEEALDPTPEQGPPTVVSPSLRAGAYLAHGPLAARWLMRSGTEEEVASWVSVHHRPELWPEAPIPAPALRALAQADE
jgi:hypothetical protein